MINISMAERDELDTCVLALENVLVALDDIGAGVAAIHVDAAINQLKGNLEFVRLAGPNGSEHAFNELLEHPLDNV